MTIHTLEIPFLSIYEMLVFLMETFRVRCQKSWLCKVTGFVILFHHSFQKGVNSVTCYIMIEMRQVVSYFSFQGNINSEGGQHGVYTALWFMQVYCGTCLREVRYRNLLFLRPVGDLLFQTLQGFSFSCQPSIWLQLGSDLSLYWTL